MSLSPTLLSLLPEAYEYKFENLKESQLHDGILAEFWIKNITDKNEAKVSYTVKKGFRF